MNTPIPGGKGEPLRITVIGSGNVGSALGLALIDKGYDVLFYDVSAGQLDKLSQYKYTTIFEDAIKSKLLFICVPTEALPNGDCDMSIYESIIERLGENKYQGIVCQTSTCPPGSARKYQDMLCHGYINVEYVVMPSHYSMAQMRWDAANPVRTMIGTVDGKPNNTMVEICLNIIR